MSLDTLFSEDFETYRKLEAEKCVGIIRGLITGQHSGEFFKGAMFMLKAIINLPVDYAKSPEAKERAIFLRDQMMRSLEAKLSRVYLEEE